ncbi:MAG: ComEA family DNA-binding protein [Clostridiales bacterium]|nr:ComEA family DNA-binding protein [Clostridiales bacterium]
MLWEKRGLVAALLCVVLIGGSGCARSDALYTVGLRLETEMAAEDSESLAGSETAAAGSELGGADGSGENPVDGSASDTLDGLAAMVSTPLTEPETEAVVGYVYVCGAVNAPGVYPIWGDMRVCDAIAQAGGFSSDADEEWLNQAAVVCDGQKLYVYSAEETDQMKASGISPEGMDDGASVAAGAAVGESGIVNEAVSAGNGEGDTDASDGKVNLNTATAEELMTLPGIGESKAAAILAYRSEHGSFASIEEIQNISGIKSGVFSKIKDLITV